MSGALRMRARMIPTAPVIVWLAALALAAVLFARQQPSARVVAYAAETVYTVATSSPGRLRGLQVEPQQLVSEGQIVATLDESALQLRASAARAELERLRAELERRRVLEDAMTGDALEQQRRFAEDRERAHVDYLRALGEQEEDRVRVDGLSLELARLETLGSQGIASAAQLDRVRTEHQALERRIHDSQPVIDELRARYQEALRRHEELLARAGGGAPEADQLVAPFRWAMRAQEIALEEVALARTGLALRAPARGRVDAILAHPGEFLSAGQRVMTIIDTEPEELVAYVDEVVHLRVETGMRAVIRRTADGTQATTTILRKGTRMMRVPPRSTGDNTIVRYAMPVFLAVPRGLVPVPGEAFAVRLIDE